MISSERISKRVRQLGREISEVYGEIETPLVIVAILKGATVFAADLLRSLSIPAELEFVRAASYGAGTKTTGRVKIAHMVEASLGIDLGRSPVKDAAGPNDFPHLKKVEHRARMANYFNFQRVNGSEHYNVQKLRSFQRLLDKASTALDQKHEEFQVLLQLMLPMTTEQAEIMATVFAAWNNLLLEGKQPTDEQIVFEARENWHPDKLKIDRQRFFKAVQWLRDHHIVPEGKGKKVESKRK